MSNTVFCEVDCGALIQTYLLEGERIEILLGLENGGLNQPQVMAITSQRLLGYRGMGHWAVVTTFPYHAFIAAELHDSPEARASQVHLRLSGLMDPARVLPYLQVSDRGSFERVWVFADRLTARKVYNAMVGHLVEQRT